MPVTINEVEINTTVTDTSAASAKGGGKDAKGGGGGMSPEEIEKIIEACMLRVRHYLDDLKER